MKNKNVFIKRRGSLFAILWIMSLGMFAQNITVRGTVTDENKEPVIGATVIVSGDPSHGTVTDMDGKYILPNVPADGSLEFRFVGMKNIVAPVNGRTILNIVMEPDVQALEELVVIGYGTQRKEAVTGSVSSVTGNTLREVPSANITQALQGRIAGVQMSQTSSKPGAEMQIRIRGTRSLNASNDPLVVLDGIPFAGTLGDIDPNSIKSIDILKDASATAIYGSRGANGVILISTIKGIKGDRAKMSYNSYYGLKNIFAKYPMMDGPEFVKLRAAAGKFTQYGEDESDDVNIDWQDLLYRTGITTSHDIGITGGTQKGNYSFGIGYYKDEAIIPGQDYTRLSIRSMLDQEIGKHFKIGFSTNSNYSINNGNNFSLYTTLSTTPIANPYNADGSLKRVVKMANDNHYVVTKSVIENLGDSWIDQNKAFGSFNSAYAEIKIPSIEGLKYRVNLGLNFRTTNNGSYTGEGVFSENASTVSTASISNSLMTNWAIENLFSFDKTFNDKHQLNALAMYSAEQTYYNRSHASAKDIPSDSFQFYNLGRANGEVVIDPSNQSYFNSGLISYMGRVMYSYDDRYMISATIRSDASSRLAKGHQWHTYPAISAGWNIKNESFMKELSYINQLKVRIGYGETSNQSVDPYKTLGLLSTRPYNFGSYNTVGYYVSELPNTQLGWEYSSTWNYGLDFSFFNNQLTGTLEYYVQNTKDVLLRVGLPSTSGGGRYMANIGETQNKGIEISLNGLILNNYNGWTWEAGINLYSNKNKLLALASGQNEDKNNWWFVGHPIDVIYDYEKIGLWNETDPDYKYLQILEPGGNAGMIKVKYTGEYNSDGSPTRKINDDDRQIIDINPDFEGGFNTRVAFKDFDLSLVGTFKRGGILMSSLYSSSGYLNMLTGRRNNVKVDYWTPENTDAKYPKPGGMESSNNPKYGSTLGYFDASYMKIRTITLGYNFKKQLISNLGIDNLRIYCTIQNPFVLFSPYYNESGMDPETNSYGDENAAVPMSSNLRRLLTIGTNTPTTRNYLIGINLTF